MNSKRFKDALAFVALLALIVTWRTVVGTRIPNFTPMLAVSLFAGFLLSSQALAAVLTLSAMVASDLFLPTYDLRVTAIVYACLLLPILARPLLRSRLTGIRIGVSAILCSIIFFLATNFAHWLFMSDFERSFAGLAQCYADALPFYKYQLLADAAWTTTLFGGYALVARGTAVTAAR